MTTVNRILAPALHQPVQRAMPPTIRRPGRVNRRARQIRRGDRGGPSLELVIVSLGGMLIALVVLVAFAAFDVTELLP